MELLLFILLICFLALMFSSILSNQNKKIQSNKRIEQKLDKLIELIETEKLNK